MKTLNNTRLSASERRRSDVRRIRDRRCRSSCSSSSGSRSSVSPSATTSRSPTQRGSARARPRSSGRPLLAPSQGPPLRTPFLRVSGPQISSRITCVAGPNVGDQVAITINYPYSIGLPGVSALGESDCERQGADGMRAVLTSLRRDSGQAMVFIAVDPHRAGRDGCARHRRGLLVSRAAARSRPRRTPGRWPAPSISPRTRPSRVGRNRLRAPQLRGVPLCRRDVSDRGRIDVTATAMTPGFFARVISSPSAPSQVKAHARAAVSVPLTMKNVAPIAVKNTAACAVTNPGCYGQTMTVTSTRAR